MSDADDNNHNLPTGTGEFIVYKTTDGHTQIQLRAVEGTVWLTQRDMSELFDKSVSTISEHIKNVYDDDECRPEATFRKFRTVQSEGGREVTRYIEAYSLELILAVGYRVRSVRGVQFRQWATTVLREYLVKGFAMNDAKLKDPAGLDYFDELLERIRDIRASEKRFYQKIRDIFAQTSVDYDSTSPAATRFFATIQNKLLYSVTRHTAAELVCARAKVDEPNMGLTTWKGAVVRKSDVTIAKNYLTESEVAQLNRITTMFLDYADERARRRQQVTMDEWATKTDEFLAFNEHDVLTNNGKISSDKMKAIAEDRYATFDNNRKAAELEAAEREHIEELESVMKDVAPLK